MEELEPEMIRLRGERSQGFTVRVGRSVVGTVSVFAGRRAASNLGLRKEETRDWSQRRRRSQRPTHTEGKTDRAEPERQNTGKCHVRTARWTRFRRDFGKKMK